MNGVFLYPSANTQQLTFNSQDSINVSWSTFAHNFTSPWLLLWLTISPPPHFKQNLVLNTSVPSGGSKLVPLNYGGAYNLSNFNLQQGPLLNSSFYSSGRFNIQVNDQSKPQTWGLDAASSTSSAVSSTVPLKTLVSSPTSTISLLSQSPLSPTSVPTLIPALSHGLPSRDRILIIVFSVLVALAIALLSALLVIKTRRLKRLQNEIDRDAPRQRVPYAHGDSKETRSVAELVGLRDGASSRRGELSSGWTGYELASETTKSNSPVVMTADMASGNRADE